MLRPAYLLILLAGGALSFPVSAQINKCVDSNGKTVYSQSPCPATAKASSIRQAPAGAPSAPASGGAAKAVAPKSAAELDRDFKKRRSEQEEAAKKDQDKVAEAKTREENCKSAKGQLVNLQSGGRQVRLDENGERSFLNDEQVARETERARQAVQSWCK